MTDKEIDRLAMTLAAHVDNLQRLANTWSDDYADIYEAQEAKILALIAELYSAYSRNDALTAARIRLLNEFKKKIIALRDECYEDVVEDAEEDAEELVANEEKFHVAWIVLLLALMKAKGRKPQPKELTMENVRDIRRHGLYNGETLKGIYRKITEQDIDRIATKTIHGLLAGRTLAAIEEDVRKAFATTRRQLEMNTAGVVNGISNDVSSQLAERNGKYIDGVMWITALDERVCDECAEHEGKVFKAGTEPACPVHVNCRCHLIPVTIELAEELEDRK